MNREERQASAPRHQMQLGTRSSGPCSGMLLNSEKPSRALRTVTSADARAPLIRSVHSPNSIAFSHFLTPAPSLLLCSTSAPFRFINIRGILAAFRCFGTGRRVQLRKATLKD
ncbi:hypothetical protein TRVL_08475 [Trypanosoma vivax]|nr:hypothetical protein TRVL_08475 [Trypanosoma vivax]